MSADVLQAMTAGARRSAAERERVTPRAALEAQLRRKPDGAGFRAALRAPGIRVIAECKRRSPSRGVLRAAYDPAAIASGYLAAGAAAISVLTEPSFFDGALEDLRAVRGAVSLPVLRKDFLVSEYQLVEAAVAGADAVLLIVAALDDRALSQLLALAAALDLAALVEVHDAAELRRAIAGGAAIIGVNSRDLKSLHVNPVAFDRLAAELPSDVVAVAESGLKTAADLARLHRARYDAFLIGERFMVEPDPGMALAELRMAAEGLSV